jgi:hypothetical protein
MPNLFLEAGVDAQQELNGTIEYAAVIAACLLREPFEGLACAPSRAPLAIMNSSVTRTQIYHRFKQLR